MSQLVCPLCGRFVSLRLFDPSSFDPDVYAVNVRGLGRGKGFAVEETFSVLGVPSITGPIADRCRRILNMIEGKKVLSSSEASVLRAETEGWRGARSRSVLYAYVLPCAALTGLPQVGERIKKGSPAAGVEECV